MSVHTPVEDAQALPACTTLDDDTTSLYSYAQMLCFDDVSLTTLLR
jgi:hypothetical protein